MGAAEGIAVLHGTGLAYENPVMQTLGIEGRYAILGILLALALRRARPSWNLGVLAAWTSAGAAQLGDGEGPLPLGGAFS